MNREYFRGKNVLVIGMARSGFAAARVLTELGATASCYDSKKAEGFSEEQLAAMEKCSGEMYLGQGPSDYSQFDLAVISPGVPPQDVAYNGIVEAEKPLINELEFAYILCPGTFIGITGTNGKTTTTSLTGAIFKESGRKTEIVGNIGFPVTDVAMAADEDTFMVTEVSSFQLETCSSFTPIVTAILNMTPDHLDRHGTMDVYRNTKGKIYQNQTQDMFCVLNLEDEAFEYYKLTCPATVVPFSSKRRVSYGAFYEDGKLLFAEKDGSIIQFCRAEELLIPGMHNIENALAASAIAHVAGIETEAITSALKKFESVANRLENCGTVDGVRYINDSKGTNPDASIKALQAMEKNILLIAGGYDKHISFDEYVEECKGRVKHMFIMGECGPQIGETCDALGFADYSFKNNLEECMDSARAMAEAGDVVLLSPACASWDMYANYELRGTEFRERAAKYAEEARLK